MDSERVTNGDSSNWVISIARIKEDGTTDTNNLFWINQELGFSDESKAVWMDNMYLDDSSSPEVLFGSTRSLESSSKRGKEVYIWKVELDTTTHDPVGSSVFVAYLDEIINDRGYIAGMKRTLVAGKVQGFISRGDDKIYFFEYDWTITSGTEKATRFF